MDGPRRSSEPPPAFFGSLPSVLGPRLDQVPFERCEPSQDRDHKFAMRRRRICPGILERSELGAGLGHAPQDCQEVERRTREAIEPRDDHHVARREHLEKLAELDPVGLRAETFSR